MVERRLACCRTFNLHMQNISDTFCKLNSHITASGTSHAIKDQLNCRRRSALGQPNGDGKNRSHPKRGCQPIDID